MSVWQETPDDRIKMRPRVSSLSIFLLDFIRNIVGRHHFVVEPARKVEPIRPRSVVKGAEDQLVNVEDAVDFV